MENYYNPKIGLSSAYAIYKRQGDDNKLTLDQIKKQVAKQEPYQINRVKTKIYYFPIVGHGEHSYQADLMFPSGGGKENILTIINVITRVAYAYPQKSKSETYENLKKWYEEVPDVKHLQTDNGSEFTNKNVKDLFKHIDYYQVEGDLPQGKIERFNQTLRRLITLYQSAYKTRNYVDALPDLMYNYNHRFNKALGCSPVEANEHDQYLKELERYQIPLRKLVEYHVGDKVRIYTLKQYDSRYRAWSNEAHAIQGANKQSTPHFEWNVIKAETLKHYGFVKFKKPTYEALIVLLYNDVIARGDFDLLMAYKPEDVKKDEHNYLLLDRKNKSSTIILNKFKTVGSKNAQERPLKPLTTELIMKLHPNDSAETLFPPHIHNNLNYKIT